MVSQLAEPEGAPSGEEVQLGTALITQQPLVSAAVPKSFPLSAYAALF